jgi:hypothetical protein
MVSYNKFVDIFNTGIFPRYSIEKIAYIAYNPS